MLFSLNRKNSQFLKIQFRKRKSNQNKENYLQSNQQHQLKCLNNDSNIIIISSMLKCRLDHILKVENINLFMTSNIKMENHWEQWRWLLIGILYDSKVSVHKCCAMIMKYSKWNVDSTRKWMMTINNWKWKKMFNKIPMKMRKYI